MRKLRLENLEGRRLLAADLGALPYHNPLIAADVDYDFNVSPRDALMVINELNGAGSRVLSSDPVDPQGKQFIDVNGDGALSPIDALLIINQLNGEGETDPLVTYTAEITDTSGSPITQIVVGQTFRLSVFVQDTRPTGPTGVFQNAIDVGVENHELITFPLDTSAAFVNNLTFGSTYTNGRQASAGPAGSEALEFINEATSFATSSTPPDPSGGVYLFFSADMEAAAEGSVNFVLNQHENEPTSQVNVFDTSQTLPDNGRIDPSMISYATASLNIILDPTSPVAMDDSVSTQEDTDLLLVGGSVDLTTNDSREAGRTLSVVSVSTIAGTTQGTLDGFTYTPPANFFGSDTLTYVVEDNTGLRSSATVTIAVTAVNDAPDAINDNFNIDEESSDNVLDVLANDSAGPLETSDTITITAVTTPNNGGSVSIAADNLSLIYAPDPNFLGTETFSYTITDAGGLTDTATITIEVEPTVLPRARPDRQTVTEDSTDNSILVLANDRANAGATVFLVDVATQPNNGTATVDDNGTPSNAGDDFVLYTPNANFSGTDTFTYTMNDTADGSVASVGTVTITVAEVNDPVILVDDTANATEDTAATIAISTLLSNDSPGAGESNQTLSFGSVAPVGAGGTVAIVGSNVIYTPAADFNGTFLFTYTASDNGSPVSSDNATVTVSVAAVNDDPIAGNDTASGTEDTVLTIAASSLLTNDSAGPSDESGQTLSVTAVSSASAQGGSVNLSGTNISYTPAADFNGSDTFTYTLSDGAGGTATGTVTVTVAAVNDAPIAVADSARAFKDIALQIDASSLVANDSPGPADEAGQTLTVTAVSATAATNGTVVLNSDGTITYTPTAGYTGPASFEYTVQDNGGGATNSDTGTVNVTVEEFVPTIVSGTIWMDENNDGILDVDIDNDGDVDFFERRLSGITVTLTGSSLGQVITPQTTITLADGTYAFEDLGPGQYVVSYSTPTFMLDGKDVAGFAGDADSTENQFTINVAQPGGIDASGYNFGLLGVEAQRMRILDQLASRYENNSPGGGIEGAFFGLANDNTALWSALLDGFSDVEFAEAVLSDDGKQLILTNVDSAKVIRSTVLDSTQFVKINDAAGNNLVRVIGSSDDFDWQIVSLATPPVVSASNYLESVDEIFGQEGW